ncbi:MAG: YdcH family protein, partial [Betaproteobacteria bacterium]|nr:YdcH family protein [Betaproteobacteria bacterium]
MSDSPTPDNTAQTIALRIQELMQEHRDLDQAIHALSESTTPDELQLR